MLVKYIRDRKGSKVGVVVALDQQHIGYSICNTKKGDVFNRDKGLGIAIGRAEHNPLSIINVLSTPYSARTECLKMLDRAERYFQGAIV